MIGLQVFKGIDSNEDGLIQYEEFMTGVMGTLREVSNRDTEVTEVEPTREANEANVPRSASQDVLVDATEDSDKLLVPLKVVIVGDGAIGKV
jgi:hypothetical protein